jgi:hypothetical protein
MSFISSNVFGENHKYEPYESFGDLQKSHSNFSKKKLSMPKKSKQIGERPNSSYIQAQQYLDQLQDKRERVKLDLQRMNIVKGKETN